MLPKEAMGQGYLILQHQILQQATLLQILAVAISSELMDTMKTDEITIEII